MRRTYRTAFTLIELLVVISILVTLMALTVAGLGQVRIAERNTYTRQTVTVLQLRMNERVSKTIDKARSIRNPYRPTAVNLCNGDIDLAESVLCYAYLRVEFPETFVEATSGFPLLKMPPSPRFVNVPSFTVLAAADQASALLYIALDGDEVDATQVGVDIVSGWHYFKDSYGKPILFQRWYQNSETNQVPYANPSKAFKDPLDPTGKLRTWPLLGALQAQTGCAQIGDNNNKIITIELSHTLPNGDIVYGHSEVARK